MLLSQFDSYEFLLVGHTDLSTGLWEKEPGSSWKSLRYEICGRVIGNTIKGVLSTSKSYYISHLNPYYGNTRVWFELTSEWTRITSFKDSSTKIFWFEQLWFLVSETSLRCCSLKLWPLSKIWTPNSASLEHKSYDEFNFKFV